MDQAMRYARSWYRSTSRSKAPGSRAATLRHSTSSVDSTSVSRPDLPTWSRRRPTSASRSAAFLDASASGRRGPVAPPPARARASAGSAPGVDVAVQVAAVLADVAHVRPTVLPVMPQVPRIAAPLATILVQVAD